MGGWGSEWAGFITLLYLALFQSSSVPQLEVYALLGSLVYPLYGLQGGRGI